MSSITTAIDFALRGADTDDLDNLRLRVEEALYRREQVISDRIVAEVVHQFGVPESVVRVRLADTGMFVRGDDDLDDEAEIDDEDEDDEDEKDALFTDEDEDARPPAQKESDGSVSSAVAALIRAITARLA